jgi:hypothetical protein
MLLVAAPARKTRSAAPHSTAVAALRKNKKHLADRIRFVMNKFSKPASAGRAGAIGPLRWTGHGKNTSRRFMGEISVSCYAPGKSGFSGSRSAGQSGVTHPAAVNWLAPRWQMSATASVASPLSRFRRQNSGFRT